MASLPILWIEARVHAHATEDEDRVRAALGAALPAGEDRREALEGHMGNPIVRIVRRVDASAPIRQTWEAWRASGILEALGADGGSRLDDEGVLHMRFDKQEAYLGRLVLVRETDAIDVRVRLAAHPAKPEAFRRVAAALLAGGE
ncbi:MAG: hypothetical protein A3K59_03660 [Euryarchaeota archaeon RBG_19FT_COMBO_69_17]|uniref:Putative exosome subunit n=2 Tax=environmental samples TaxID=68359 RepID=A0A0H4TMB3_9EURY|nr:putative exosome subunit [uncultured euryarchaeote Rifle_16ft_4_minimus_23719]AKQ02725.1 putative exosome subunit [uncultured euryarchaeote Rifle_16ft_4_minimus_37664]OGS62129.1 MAG: hypothetical protein A3K59_03660 [Euryarchaeota archaeon RBG_19FT_COMBO_69_17]